MQRSDVSKDCGIISPGSIPALFFLCTLSFAIIGFPINERGMEVPDEMLIFFARLQPTKEVEGETFPRNLVLLHIRCMQPSSAVWMLYVL